jgi:hypothetical protein
MKRSKAATLLLALIAALTCCALASTAASAALPEFNPGSKGVTFTSAPSEGFSIESALGEKFSCPTASISGTIANEKELSGIVLKFGKTGDSSCVQFLNQTGHGGEIVTKELKGRIAYLNKSTKSVGLLLEPVSQPFAEGLYFGAPATIKGSVIGKIATGERREFPVEYARVANGLQLFECFEGEEVMHNLTRKTSFSEEVRNFSIQGTITLKTSVFVQIKA